MKQYRFLSLIAAVALTVSMSAQTPVLVEFFFDTDPGYGRATVLPIDHSGEHALTFDMRAVREGAHVLCVRSQDDQGRWSATLTRPLYVMPKPGTAITAIEYFFDADDPGAGRATAVDLGASDATVQSSGAEVQSSTVQASSAKTLTFGIDIDCLEAGPHQLNIRACDDYGRWSLVSSQPFHLTAASGIKWLMPVSIDVKGPFIMLSDANDVRRADSCVELFSIAGQRLHNIIWKHAQRQLAIPLPAHHASVIVKVTDTQSGRYVIKKIGQR